MEKISVVCIFNNESILDSMLKKGLCGQINIEYELILIDGRKSDIISPAYQYNEILEKITTNNVVFLHQDIFLKDVEFLYKLNNHLNNNPNSIYGICGSINDKRHIVYSNCLHGIRNTYLGNTINDLVQVDTLDEVLVASSISVFKNIMFDPNIFDGWHLFVADFCLSAINRNIPIYVLPYETIHKNTFEMPHYFFIMNILPKEYFIYLNKLRSKHKKSFKVISMPCIMIKTSSLWYLINIKFKTKLKNNFKRFIRKHTM